jgi:hypothetical protein
MQRHSLPAILGKFPDQRSWADAADPEGLYGVGACVTSDIPAYDVTKTPPRPNSLYPGERSGTCGARRWHCSLADTVPWCSP